MGYMFEPEIEAILNTVRSKTIGEEDSISLRRVLNSEVHPAIKAYIRAEVEQKLEQEREREVRSKRFPYSHAEVMSLQRQIDLLLVQHYTFDKADFLALLDESVHFQFNYLCRPQWTLVSMVFGNQRRVSTEEMEKKLMYCVDYAYFPDLIKRYVVGRGLAEMEYDEFRSLLSRIDTEVVAQHSSLELARMLRALFAFVDEGKILPHDRFDQPSLPINAAVVFFEDKQMENMKARLETERDARNVSHVTVAELATIIERVRTGNEEAVVSSPEEPFLGAFATPGNGEEAGVSPSPPGHEPAATEETDVTNGNGEGSDHLLEPIHPASATSPSREVVDVYAVFSRADRKMFVKAIFKKDEGSFRSALDELNALATWEEASHYLDTLFVARGLDPFSMPAVQFTERVYSRYFPSPAR